jgi:hypothetical protein
MRAPNATPPLSNAEPNTSADDPATNWRRPNPSAELRSSPKAMKNPPVLACGRGERMIVGVD